MTTLNRQIIKAAGCNVIDTSLTTIESHKKDLTRRLNKQQKALIKTIKKGWMGQEIIETSITNIETTLKTLETL